MTHGIYHVCCNCSVLGDKMRVVDIRRSCVVPAVVLEDKMMDTKEALKELEDLTVDYVYSNLHSEEVYKPDA